MLMFPIKTKVPRTNILFSISKRNLYFLVFSLKTSLYAKYIAHLYQYINNLSVNDSFELLLRTTVRHHPLTFDRYRMDCVNDKKRKNLALYIVGKGIPNYWIEETRSLLNIENFETGTRFSKLSFSVYIPEFTLIYIIQFYYMGEKTVLFSFQVKN